MIDVLLRRWICGRLPAVAGLVRRVALDPGLQPRPHSIPRFLFPGQSHCEAIRRGISVGVAKLARFNAIRNSAPEAAFHAAEPGDPVRMTHFQRAANLEAAKRERPFTDGEARGWL